MAGGAALVGRARELSRIAAAVGDSRVAAAVVAGEPGVGKTRLAVAALRAAEEKGFATVQALATRAAAAVPLGALAPLLPPVERSVDTTVDMLAHAGRALAARARERPLVLLVDDAHLLDDASATVVQEVATRGDVFVVVTLRTGEPVPAAVDALLRHDGNLTLEVGPLGREDTEQLAAELLGGVVDGGTARELWERSAGNPLFVRELVLGGLDAELFTEDAGVWRLTEPLRLSPRLAGLMEARLVDLDDRERAALEVVALGEPVGLEALAGVTDPGDIEGLQRRGLLRVEASLRRREVRLAHPLHGDVVREGMGGLRSIAVHRRLYEWVRGTGCRRREDPLRVALWGLKGGGPVDAGVLVEGGRRAHYAHDEALAERLASVAVQAGGGVEARQLLAEALAGEGRPEEAVVVLAQAAASAEDDRQLALVAMTRATLLFWGLDRADEAVAAARAAEEHITDAAWRDEVVALRATFELLRDRPREALRLVAPILARAEGRAFAEAAIAAVPALGIMGRGEEACALADRAFVVHLGLGDQEQMSHPGIHMVAKSVALGEMGELATAEQVARFGYGAALHEGAVEGQAWCALVLGRALWLRQPGEAGRWFREAAALYGRLEQDGPRRWGLAGAALCEATMGEAASARELIDEADRLGHAAVTMMASDVARARAWVPAAAGDLGQARAHLADACAIAAERRVLALEVAALHDRARLGDAAEVADRLEQVAATVDGPLAGARARHARALAAGDPPAVAAAAEELEALGATVLAAEAAAQAASQHRRRGSARVAARWAQRAAALAAEAGGVDTPAMTLAGEAGRLTRRELEVARLAAGGLANRDIAAALSLSPRTVENHLQRAYEKLGVAGRDDLPGVLGSPGE